ncbi:MAG: hypothetical protein U9R79_18865 [Armatimonadota bacterium]|nr:hypothetical protein [Armatimonadota bacterium]
MLRRKCCAVALMVLVTLGTGVAQETADIVVGGQVVARVRERGEYESVQHRAAAIDETINQVLAATDDPAGLEVTLEEIDGLWTILIDDTKIMSVYPAEAEANGTTPGLLGAQWVRIFREALPNAVRVQVQDVGEAGPAPAEVGEEPSVDAAGVEDEPVTGAVTNTGSTAVEVLEVPPSEGEPEEIVAGQGAKLLILEAFNEARELPEDNYLVRRETMAQELFDNLVQVLTSGKATGRLEGVGVGTAAVPPPPSIAETERETAAPETAPQPAPSEVVAVEETVAPLTAPVVPTGTGGYEISDEGRAKIEAKIPENDPSYANVLDKVIIKAKFRAATGAYQQMRSTDPDTAAEAREVMSAARTAYTNASFDEAQSYLDVGLRTLGVTEWEQHIDAAMADLGLTD